MPRSLRHPIGTKVNIVYSAMISPRKSKNSFERIGRNPLLYARVERMAGRQDIRRCRLHRFPYLVIFRYRFDETLIVAVAHVRRKPFYWLERLK